MSQINDQIEAIRSKAEAQFNKAQATAQQVIAVAQKAAKDGVAVANGLYDSVSGTAREQFQAVQAGGNLNEQIERQKALVANYEAPLKTAGTNLKSLAVEAKNGVLAAVK